MASPAMAETGSDPDRWKFSGSAYLWAAGTEGTSSAEDEIDVSFSDALDGIIGAQVVIDLGDSWYLSCYADVGAGDSKLTWQAWPEVGYRFKKVDLVAGYRHLEWETDDGDTFDDLNFSGPMIGVKFRF